MLVQPRFGVSSPMPVLVFSGPGDPIPTPSTFLPDSLIDALASLMMRPMTGSAPCAASVGSETTARISDPGPAAREDAGHEIRPTDINSDDVAHQGPRLLESRPRPGGRACSDDAPTGTRAARATSRGGTPARRRARRHPVAAVRTRSP